MIHFGSALVVLLAMTTSISGSSANPTIDEAVAETCTRRQCLLLDFLQNRNGAATDKAAAESAFPGAIAWPPGEVPDREFCLWVPSTDCFSDVLVMRQQIHRLEEHSLWVGCVVVGGITHADGRYGSFHIVYVLEGVVWQPRAVNSYRSLDDDVIARDLLHDACPGSEERAARFLPGAGGRTFGDVLHRWLPEEDGPRESTPEAQEGE